jgi:hypothetical protein
MLEDEHRSSMGEELLHHLLQMLCKYYVAKSPKEQKKKIMKSEKNYDEKKRKVRQRKRDREKNEKKIK